MALTRERFRHGLVLCSLILLHQGAPRPVLANPFECRELEQRYETVKKNLAERQVHFRLFDAVQKGCMKLAEELIAAGASIATRRREGDTPLHHAARAGQTDMVRLLLDRGADGNARDLAGSTPLFMAVEANRLGTVALLLARGAAPDVPGKSGATPLSAAAFNGSDRMVAELLKHGADPKALDRTGKGPLVYAVGRGHAAVAKRLLDAGVDVNQRYGNDLTALMWAAGYANDVPEAEGVKVVELLLARGAALDEVDDRGRTALMVASELDHPAVISMLIARGAKADLRDKEGKTALDLAISDAARRAQVR